MRLRVVLVLGLLAAVPALAGPPFTVDELPQPFGGGIGPYIWLSEDGTVAGCMERGPGDWLPFAWNPSYGLELIDGGAVGDSYRCRIAGVSDDGLVAGYLPSAPYWPVSVPFVWSPTRGLTLFEDSFYPDMLFSSAGQLALRDVFHYQLVIWTESEGRLEVDLGERDIVRFRQNARGQVAGVLEFPIPQQSLFVWSRERGLETYFEHDADWAGDTVVPTVERLSDDGWTAGYMADSTPPFGDRAYVRAPDGTIYPFSVGQSLDIYEFGSDGLITGQAYSERGNFIPFIFQPGFGVEIPGFGESPYTYLDSANDASAGNVVVGSATEGYDSRMFIWERGKGVERIGLGGRSSSGGLITDQGWAVGSGYNPQNRFHPFVWSRRTGAIELSWGNDNGWRTWVTGLNTTGTVIGRGEDRPFVFLPRVGLLDPRDWLPPLEAGSHEPSRLRDSGRFLLRGRAVEDGRLRYFLFSRVAPGPRPSPVDVAPTAVGASR